MDDKELPSKHRNYLNDTIDTALSFITLDSNIASSISIRRQLSRFLDIFGFELNNKNIYIVDSMMRTATGMRSVR